MVVDSQPSVHPAPPSVRPARASDAPAIAGLLGELGYQDDAANVRDRLGRIDARHDAEVLVAELDGQVAALAAYQLMDLLEQTRPQCRITTLVVGEAHRRRGLARALMNAIESIAVDHGCFRLEVTTQPPRADAIDLYVALGFHERRLRLVKPLELRRP